MHIAMEREERQFRPAIEAECDTLGLEALSGRCGRVVAAHTSFLGRCLTDLLYNRPGRGWRRSCGAVLVGVNMILGSHLDSLDTASVLRQRQALETGSRARLVLPVDAPLSPFRWKEGETEFIARPRSAGSTSQAGQ